MMVSVLVKVLVAVAVAVVVVVVVVDIFFPVVANALVAVGIMLMKNGYIF